MALLPLALSLLVHHIAGDRAGAPAAAARELLFFALSMCSLTLVDLRNLSRRARGRPGYESVFQMCLLVTIAAAVLYGAFVTGEIRHDAVVVRTAYSWSIVVALVAVTMATGVQGIIHSEDRHAGI